MICHREERSDEAIPTYAVGDCFVANSAPRSDILSIAVLQWVVLTVGYDDDKITACLSKLDDGRKGKDDA